MIRFSSVVRLVAAAGLIAATGWVLMSDSGDAAPPTRYPSPLDVALTRDGATLYVTNHTGDSLAIIDTRRRTLKGLLPLPGGPAGLALSADGKRLYVALSESDAVAVVDTAERKVLKTVRVGARPWGLAVTGGGLLVVCNRAGNDLSVVDPRAGAEVRRAPASREPMYPAVAGNMVIAGNGLPDCAATDYHSAADLTLLDLTPGAKPTTLRLPPGSNEVRRILVSPDGRWAYFVHLVSRFNVPTTQLERGWMNTNALTVVDVNRRTVYATILLDETNRGYANPYGIALTPNGDRLLVTHAGSNNVTVIDRRRLHRFLSGLSARERLDLRDRLSVIGGNQLGYRLPSSGKGPHGVAVSPLGRFAYVANYYSDTVAVLDLKARRTAAVIPVGPRTEPDQVRRGEQLFHDATLCFQHWQSCASCHPDARADGFNWDLLNDGLCNPKNVKSLLWADKTPPMMSTGVRDTMKTAILAGIRYIEFREPQPGQVEAIAAYLRSLTPRPSPHLLPDGRLSPAARRGRRLFNSDRTQCARCHPPPLYTDLQTYDVGTHSPLDGDAHAFDTPTLVELYRTAPYLHDGSRRTLRDVLTHNPGDRHGTTSTLTPAEIEDLLAFLKSL